MQEKTDPADWTAETFHVGLTAGFEYLFTQEDVKSFSNLSGDWNPLHNDESFAISRGYRRIVAHGAMQQSLISRLIGMYLPGRRALIRKVATQYMAPALVGDQVHVGGEVKRWSAESRMGIVECRISRADNTLISLSEIDVGITGATTKDQVRPGAREESKELAYQNGDEPLSRNTRTVLVLGASSELAKGVFRSETWKGYNLVKVARRHGEADVVCDFELWSDSQWADLIISTKPYAIVQFASAAPNRCPPSEMVFDALFRNILVHLKPLRVAAQLIAAKKATSLRRIVATGSYGARHISPEPGFESYAYAKSIASFYCRDIAREIAAFDATCNIVSPAETGIGMNGAVSERMKMMLAAKSPNQRLVSARDISEVLEFLLSDAASAVSGQELIIAGGRSA